jgi:hypothetical protein
MSPVQNVWRQLVERRLWPVAIVLVAALAAVPLMLAKDPDPVPPPPAPAADSNDGQLATEPIVSLATAEPDTKRRKVLGSAKNPFEVNAPKAEQPADGGDATPAPAGGQPDAPQSGSGGGTPDAAVPPSSAAPTTPTPSAPVEPTKPARTYEPEELTVRFGAADGTQRQSVTRLEPLPSAELPALIYMGVLKDGKTAEFLLDANVSAVGDAECVPNLDDCSTIRMRVGETEFLDVKDEAGNVTGQYQLDLLKIHNVKKHSDATPSRTKSAGLKSGARTGAVRSVSGRVAAQLR